MTASADYALIAKALGYLEENFKDQPNLDRLSEELAVSRFHLQRLFTRWAGVSPKRFLQFLTVEHAKTLLRDSEPILSAAFASGLSGPARLHDLFVHTEGVTPGEFKLAGSSLTISYGIHETPFGTALLAQTNRGICHLSFLGSEDGPSREAAVATLEEEWHGATLMEATDDTENAVRTIFSAPGGTPPEAPLSLFLKGTNFQIKVWSALLRIPPGNVTTYGRLARFLDSPGAARAVGSAVGRNRIAYLIPCHRVIREMGAFGQYRWGSERKKAMLGWEAAQRTS
jgi:AraC family transcriptional regulator of adaptative response/methylated-DNA-[protein]-cysteine methyltransferase